MNARTFAVGIAAALLLPAVAQGQDAGASLPLAQHYLDPINGVSLDQAITIARGQEPGLRAARTAIDAARGLERQAGLRPNPTVTFERREEPRGTDNQTMVGVQWPLDLFRRSARVAVAAHALTAAERSVADRERVLAAEVRRRYGDLLAALRDLDVLDATVAAAGRQRDLLRARVEQGASAPLERDLLEVEAARLEAERLLLTGRADAAMVELKRLLGMRPDDPLRARQTLSEVVDDDASRGVPVDTPAGPALRPDVEEAVARVQVADAAIERAQREGRFDVSLFGSYMRMDAGFPQRGITADGNLVRIRGLFHTLSAGAMVTVPLLNRNQGEIAAARAERAGAAATHEAVLLAAQAEIAAARARDSRARQAVALFGARAHALARQNLAVISQSYELGRVTIFDVLAEQRRYLDVERAYTDALREAYEARTALFLALGDMP